MFERLEQYMLRRKINTVINRTKPLSIRHRQADEISLRGNKATLFSFKESLIRAGSIVSKTGSIENQTERRFLFVAIDSLRSFSRGRSIKV